MKHETLNASIKRALKGKTLEKIDSDDLLKIVLNAELASIIGTPGVSAGQSSITPGESTSSYNAGQMDAMPRTTSGVGSAIGFDAASTALSFGLNQISAYQAYQRQNAFYNNHLSMPAKVAEYKRAGLNPYLLGGAGVGATSAPNVDQASPVAAPGGVLSTILGYKTQMAAIHQQEESNRIREKSVDSEIAYRQEQQETQRKVNQWFDANQVVSLNKSIAETQDALQRVRTGAADEALKGVQMSREAALAALTIQQAIEKEIDNRYRDQWNRINNALMSSQTALNKEQAANLIEDRNRIIAAAVGQSLQNGKLAKEYRILGVQQDMYEFARDHQRGDLVWGRIGQSFDMLKDAGVAVGSIMGAANIAGAFSAKPVGKLGFN